MFRSLYLSRPWSACFESEDEAAKAAAEKTAADKAAAENVALYSTEMSMFEAVGKLYELGARSC